MFFFGIVRFGSAWLKGEEPAGEVNLISHFICCRDILCSNDGSSHIKTAWITWMLSMHRHCQKSGHHFFSFFFLHTLWARMSWENLTNARDGARETARAELVVGVCRRDAWFWLPGLGRKYWHGGKNKEQRKTEEADKCVKLLMVTREGLLTNSERLILTLAVKPKSLNRPHTVYHVSPRWMSGTLTAFWVSF